MIVLLVLLTLAALTALALILLYNRLVKLRNRVAEAWSGIEVQLKRRANLIPNLLEAVKGYMGHERGLLEAVTAARARSMEARGVAEQQQAERALSGELMRFFAVAENYPDLKASDNFQDLQRQLSEVEDQIQLARRYYNGSVRDLNNAVETFPSNWVAGRFGFERADFFEIDDPSDRVVPKVAF